jgi:hypothetical protein
VRAGDPAVEIFRVSSGAEIQTAYLICAPSSTTWSTQSRGRQVLSSESREQANSDSSQVVTDFESHLFWNSASSR